MDRYALEMKNMWFNIIKKYSRCQMGFGGACIRPVKKSGDLCKWCEDDSWNSLLPPDRDLDVMAGAQFRYLHPDEKSRILDEWVERNPESWKKLHKDS